MVLALTTSYERRFGATIKREGPLRSSPAGAVSEGTGPT